VVRKKRNQLCTLLDIKAPIAKPRKWIVFASISTYLLLYLITLSHNAKTIIKIIMNKAFSE
jgi:hypothetical protein